MAKTYLDSVYGHHTALSVAASYKTALRGSGHADECRVVMEPSATPHLYYLYAVFDDEQGATEWASSFSDGYGQRNGSSARPFPEGLPLGG